MIRRRDVLRATTGLACGLTAGCSGIGGERFDANCEEGGFVTGDGTARGDTPWPEYAADPGNTSTTTVSGPEEGMLAWRVATCAPMGETSPVVGDGTVYVSMNGDPGTRAFDATTGEELWTAEFVGRPPGPALAAGRLYVAGHTLRAFDAADGTEEWTFERSSVVTPVGGEESRPGPISSAPTVVEGMVYVCGGRDVPWVFALDAQTGEVVWRYQLAGPRLQSAPAVDSTTVYVVDDRGSLIAVNRRNGTKHWEKASFGNPSATPSVADDQLLVNDQERGVTALTSTGEILWRSDVSGGQGPVAVAEGQVFVVQRTEVVALDRTSGEEVWRYDSESLAGLGHPVVAEGIVYVGRGGESVEVDNGSEPRGAVIAIDGATGGERWQFSTRGIPAGEGGPYAGTRGSLAISDGTLFVTTRAGDLYAIGDA